MPNLSSNQGASASSTSDAAIEAFFARLPPPPGTGSTIVSGDDLFPLRDLLQGGATGAHYSTQTSAAPA